MKGDVKTPAEQQTSRERDHEVVLKVQAGDVEAFEALVKSHQKRIFRLVYTLLRDATEADCVTQDVFIKAFKALKDFKGEAAFESWITRITINTVRDRVRRRKPVVSFSEMGNADDDDTGGLPRHLDPADGTSPERDAMSRDIRRRLTDALASLSPRQRAVFVMKHYEEKTIPEIGTETGLDEGTIKSHLFRAGRKLRALLEDLR